MSDRPFQFSLRKLLIYVGALCVVCAVLSLFVQAVREDARLHGRRQYCRNNLTQIAIALHNYHDLHDCLPMPFSHDAAGNPLHSWRVAIAEFVGSGELRRHYDYTLPWNDPKNLEVSNQFANPFICPSANQPKGSGFTNYVMVVGQKRAADPPAIMVVEIADSDIHWTEPRDLNFDEISFNINDKTKPSISSHHAHGAMVLYANGRVKFLDESTDPDELKKLLTENLEDGSGRKKKKP